MPKKLTVVLVVLVTLLCFGAYAVGSDGYVIFTNYFMPGGKTQLTTTIDGRIYVPLDILESLGCNVVFNEDSGTIAIYTGGCRPVIKSDDEEFIKTINAALDLLLKYDPPAYSLVCTYCRLITYDKLQKEWLAQTTGVNDITFNTEFVKNKSRFIPSHVAGILVHEATHICNYNHSSFSTSYNEWLAYEYAGNTLQILNAPSWAIDSNKRSQRAYSSKRP